MRKKSNHTATDSAARYPASRYPFAATATTTRIMTSAASVFGMLARNGTRMAATATGATNAASTASWSRLNRRITLGTFLVGQQERADQTSRLTWLRG